MLLTLEGVVMDDVTDNSETLELENGNKVHFTKHPRYGFWSVNFDKGGIPSILQGHWQSLTDLKAKVAYYLEHREKNRTKFKEA